MTAVQTKQDRSYGTRQRPSSKIPGWPAQRNLGPLPLDAHALYEQSQCNDPSSDAHSCNLAPHEKSVEIESQRQLEARYRFAQALAERRRWMELLPEIEPNERKIARFNDCGSLAYIESNTVTKRWRIRCNRCKQRVCPACRQTIQLKYAQRIRQVTGNIQPREWQHITLTIRHTDEPLKSQINFLRSAFRKLRHRSQWKRSVLHGYAVLEIAFNNKTKEWHPHLHVLARCRFIDYKQLHTDWFQVTRGSQHVHCRRLKPNDTAAEYVTSYLGKPPSLEMMSDASILSEYYDAMKSARLMIPFGFNSKLPDAPKPRDPEDAWKSHGSLYDFVVRLRSDDHVALSTLDLIYQSRRNIAMHILRVAKIEPTLFIAQAELHPSSASAHPVQSQAP